MARCPYGACRGVGDGDIEAPDAQSGSAIQPRPTADPDHKLFASVALKLATNGLLASGAIAEDPLTRRVAAVSCGIFKGTPVLDLDYDEDSNADADANFVLIEGGHIAEVQATAEGATYDEEGLLRLLRLARIGCEGIFAGQAKAVGG